MIHSAAIVLIAYLIGSLPIGLFVGKAAKGIDIREYGSGNIGASNVWRILGWQWGLPVFLLDVGKGYLPVLAAHHLSLPGNPLPVLAGLAAIVGHNFSVFLGFRGGKGVATSLGVTFGLSPVAGVVGFVTWGIILLLTKYVSMSSVAAVPVAAVIIWLTNSRGLAYALFGIVAVIFVVVKHRSNFERLRAGTEPKFSFGGKKE